MSRANKFAFKFGGDSIDRLVYWINERHRIYELRRAGMRWPWTKNEVLQEFKFTNVFRELDKGTLALREMVKGITAPDLLVFNIIWYRMFNRYEHAKDVGVIHNANELASKIEAVSAAGKKVFTSAHMTVGRAGEAKQTTMVRTLRDVERRISQILAACNEGTMKHLFTALQQMRFYGIGKFIGYEIVSDFRWYPMLWPEGEPIDTMSWANIGPGCRRGLNRLGYVGDSVDDLLRVMQLVVPQLERHVTDFHLPFELREVEHSLCEFDKFCRGGSKERFVPPLMRT